MMGCGKSTVGRLLARRLSREFLDADAEIVRRVGRTIPEIFSGEGEAAFRGYESALIDAAASGAAVVALGGGAIAQPGAAARLRASGCVVYLRARPAVLLARIGDPVGRPLLAGLSPAAREAKLAELLVEREPAYLTAAIVVDTDGLSAAEVARDLSERLSCGEGSEMARP